MSKSLVLTVIGEDRPGLVEALARAVSANAGNWLESRMARMAGKFAGIVRVEVAEAAVEALLADLAALESRGLRVHADHDADAAVGAAAAPAPDARVVTLDLVGTDQPGIVRDVSRILANRGVNVEELTTSYSAAPMSGEPLFRASARLRLPPEARLDDLRADLEQVAHSLMVDLTLA